MLLKGNNASTIGAKNYLDYVLQGVDTLVSGLSELKKNHEEFNYAIQDLANILSHLSVNMVMLKSGINLLIDQYSTLDSGINEYTDSVTRIVAGYESMANGMNTLGNGSQSLLKGTGTLKKGTSSLYDGINTL